jgi:glutamine synthetase
MAANVMEIYGSKVFNEHVMKERLPSATYESLKATLHKGKPLDIEVANVVASVMKRWAMEQGATHYTHWFQPLTGITSEKHDGFVSPQTDGTAIMEFSGKELIKGEPDASSFPSGGLRATCEARGYTAWDASSYAFVKDDVLCIPTAFCSYTGEALDKKTPLLRSMSALSIQACRILKLFGKDCEYVSTTVGPEQEYFLIKKEDYLARQDLILTGRTLFGAPSAKGQELEEHYFGTLRPCVSDFMKDLDDELWRLGIPAKTKHNEVAPCQHELAPIFDTTNVAIDHNLLTMEMMKKVADRHGLVCLLHEKPFEGVNGSGKHNNWSMSTKHENLLDPGTTPMENLQFLVFLAAVIKAVDEYADLLRTAVATPGNDHRLGANEAPPAIISIFVGEELEAVIDAIASDSPYAGPVKMKMDLGVDVLPTFSKDTTDRNRTSPFAFTGNKFEFRMPGSAENLSDANTILNTAVAKELKGYADELENSADFRAAAIALVKRTIHDHRRVIFNGNGYSAEWEAEAEKRGLPNKKYTPAALPALVAPKNIRLMEDFGVLTKTEMESRYEVELEHYSKIINIEALTMLEMARKQLLPAVTEYLGTLAGTIGAKLAVSETISCKAERKALEALSADADAMSDATDVLQAALDKARAMHDESAKASYFHDAVVPAMDVLRAAADSAEVLCGEDYWPLPSYSKMLYYVE